MTHLRENFFAVLVDDDAIGTPYIEEDRIRYTVSRISANSDSTYIGQGNYKPVCVTHRISERHAAMIVERQRGEGKFRDYAISGSLAKYGTYLLYTATASLTSLLKSKGLDTEKNYAIIEKL